MQLDALNSKHSSENLNMNANLSERGNFNSNKNKNNENNFNSNENNFKISKNLLIVPSGEITDIISIIKFNIIWVRIKI